MIQEQQPEQATPFTAETAVRSTQQSGNVYAEQKLKEAALMQKEQQLATAEQRLVMAGQQMAAEKQGMDNVLAALAQGGTSDWLDMSSAGQRLADTPTHGWDGSPRNSMEAEAVSAAEAINEGADINTVMQSISPEAAKYLQMRASE